MTPRQGREKRVEKLPRRDAWTQVAAATGGRFHPGKRPAKDKVIITHGPWEVWLDTYVVSNGQTSVTYTRTRAYFLGRRHVSLLVRRRNLLDRIGEALGFASRPPVGRALTETYVVKGKPPTRIPSLFSGSHLGEAVMAVPSLRLEIKRAPRKMRLKLGASAGVAVCRTTGVIVDPAHLVGLIEVVKEALEGLQRIGEADSRPLRGEAR